MKIHEYQAKEIFGRFGIPVPEGQLVTSRMKPPRLREY
jgi:succinyl-CoA synthetase beta subunit